MEGREECKKQISDLNVCHKTQKYLNGLKMILIYVINSEMVSNMQNWQYLLNIFWYRKSHISWSLFLTFSIFNVKFCSFNCFVLYCVTAARQSKLWIFFLVEYCQIVLIRMWQNVTEFDVKPHRAFCPVVYQSILPDCFNQILIFGCCNGKIKEKQVER